MLYTVVLLLLAGSAVAKKGYQLQYTAGKDFNVTILGAGPSNTLLLSHSTTAPMLYVGADQQSILEFRGNFHIQDYVIDRIGLPDFTVTSSSDSDVIGFSFGQIKVNMTLSSSSYHPLIVSFDGMNPNFGNLWMRIAATPEEKVFGLGEQYSYLNLRGRTFPIWTREQGVGRNKSNIVTFIADNYAGGAGGDYHTTYFPQATFVSSRGFYCHYDGYNYAEYNFQVPTFHEVYVIGQVSRFYFYASYMRGLISHLSRFLGCQPELPDWIYTGAILGVQGGTDTMMSRLKTAQDLDVPVSGLWIQDWSGGIKTSFGYRVYWDWKWNTTYYPGLKDKIADLKTKGIRVLSYINPNLIAGGDLFNEAAGQGHLVKDTSGQPYLTDFGEFHCGTVDLTSPAGFDWYKRKIQENMIDLGLGGWMADFGEYLPTEGAVFASGQTGRALHNQWPVLWARCNREALEERGVMGDVVFWMRAGAAGTGNYSTLMWAGDQNVDFSYGDGLPSTVPAALNLAMSGIGLTHIDVGGYTTAAQFKQMGVALIRTEELLLRSAEAAIFSPMFRSHEGNQPQANVQFYSTPEIEKQFGRLARLFVHMTNYTKDIVKQNSLFGNPVQRPLFIEYPDDVTSWTITYQFMFGPDVLVAPVIQSKVTSMKVYLPPGKWGFFWTPKVYTSAGQFVTVSAPLGKPPAFYLTTSSFSDIFDQIRTRFPAIPGSPTTLAPHANTTVAPPETTTVAPPATTTSKCACTGGAVKKAAMYSWHILALLFYLFARLV